MIEVIEMIEMILSLGTCFCAIADVLFFHFNADARMILPIEASIISIIITIDVIIDIIPWI